MRSCTTVDCVLERGINLGLRVEILGQSNSSESRMSVFRLRVASAARLNSPSTVPLAWKNVTLSFDAVDFFHPNRS
jgi:hypothetical protein